MVIGAGTESPRGMTHLAILGADWHVLIERSGERYTGGINTIVTAVAPQQQHGWIGVVNAKRRNEALGGMACPVVAGCAGTADDLAGALILVLSL